MLRTIEFCLTPVAIALVPLVVAVIWPKRPRALKACLWVGIGLLLLSANDWVGRWIGIPLERRYLPPNPVPSADAIVVLGGGLAPMGYPRPSLEINEAGNRLLYAVHLFREGKAPLLLCSGGSAEPGPRMSSEAEQMRTLLASCNVPCEAILVETNSLNTFDNARYSRPILEDHQIRRVLLVTSASHMPRSVGVFRRQCPEFEIIPAPCDFMFTDPPKLDAREVIKRFIPKAEHVLNMERTLHEYVGLLYYKARGWM